MAEPVREGVEDGIQWQIMANDVLFSWQGYAHIPDGHVRRHLNADDIEPLVDVYGGVTYGPDRQGRIEKTAARADAGKLRAAIEALAGMGRVLSAMRDDYEDAKRRIARPGTDAARLRP